MIAKAPKPVMVFNIVSVPSRYSGIPERAVVLAQGPGRPKIICS
jgi:hypothetical protein